MGQRIGPASGAAFFQVLHTHDAISGLQVGHEPQCTGAERHDAIDCCRHADAAFGHVCY